MTTVTLPLIVRMAAAQLKRAAQMPVAVRLIRRYVGNDKLDLVGAVNAVKDASESFTGDTLVGEQVIELMKTFSDHMDAADLATHQMQSKLTLTQRQLEHVRATHQQLFRDFSKVNEAHDETRHIRDLAQQRCHDLEGVVADQAIKLMHQGLALKTVTTELQQAREMLHNAEQHDYERAWNEDGGYADYASARANGFSDQAEYQYTDDGQEEYLADLPF